MVKVIVVVELNVIFDREIVFFDVDDELLLLFDFDIDENDDDNKVEDIGGNDNVGDLDDMDLDIDEMVGLSKLDVVFDLGITVEVGEIVVIVVDLKLLYFLRCIERPSLLLTNVTHTQAIPPT